jgi:hypothetical protein
MIFNVVRRVEIVRTISFVFGCDHSQARSTLVVARKKSAVTKTECVSWLALSCFTVGSVLCGAGAEAAEPSAVSMLEGHWDPGSRAFYETGITITATRVTVGDCPEVSYSIIKDAQGQGPAAIRAKDAADWREIVIELQPKTQPEQNCLKLRVLAFSMPISMGADAADIALYLSRAKFEAKPEDFDGWGVWVKEK